MVDLGGYSAKGPREANEDNFYTVDFSDVNSFSDGVAAFVMVSDGMGGYQGGDVASGLAVRCAESYIGQLLEMAHSNQVSLDVEAALAEIVSNAHEAILAEAQQRGGVSMGATFVGAFLSPEHAWIGHVGDSRAYLLRGGSAQQLTEDHSQVGRLLSRGVITEEEAQSHPARNRIERALGFSDARMDFDEVDLQPSDALLLCSDGVYTMLTASALADTALHAMGANDAAEQVVQAALAGGTDDNSTAVVMFNYDRGAGHVAAPTIRTQAVDGKGSELREHGSSHAARFRQGRHSRFRRETVPRSKSSHPMRPLRAVAALFSLLVVLVAAVMFLILSANEGPAGGGDGTSSVLQESQENGVASGEQSGATSTGQSSEGSVAHQPDMVFESFSVKSGCELKYVDFAGKAWTFDDADTFGASVQLLLQNGAAVEASSEKEQFKRKKSYRVLDARYLEGLIADCRAYRGGKTVFSSELAKIAASDSVYREFVSELSGSGVDKLKKTVEYLVVDSSWLENPAPGSTGSSSQAGSTSVSDVGSASEGDSAQERA